jgi:hypothetical protein
MPNEVVQCLAKFIETSPDHRVYHCIASIQSALRTLASGPGAPVRQIDIVPACRARLARVSDGDPIGCTLASRTRARAAARSTYVLPPGPTADVRGACDASLDLGHRRASSRLTGPNAIGSSILRGAPQLAPTD